MLYVAGKKENFLENSHILSSFVQLKSVLFDLFCVYHLNSAKFAATSKKTTPWNVQCNTAPLHFGQSMNCALFALTTTLDCQDKTSLDSTGWSYFCHSWMPQVPRIFRAVFLHSSSRFSLQITSYSPDTAACPFSWHGTPEPLLQLL